MFGRRKRRGPGRAELIERKYRLEGEINALNAELRRRRAQGRPTATVEARIEQLRNRHYQTRLQIDRTDPLA